MTPNADILIEPSAKNTAAAICAAALALDACVKSPIAVAIVHYSKSRPDIVIRHLQILPQNIDLLPPARPHDGGGVISGTKQILGRADAE